jgi:uncharacterized protein YjbJ (UPF0337 family)
MVNQSVLQGNWKQIRGKLKEKWGNLADDDVASFDGNVDQLVGKIQQKTGETRMQVEQFLEQVSEESFVQDRPATSLAFAFGCGVAVGVGLALLLREREPQSTWSRGREAAEHFGKQLCDAVTAALPERLRR